MLSKIKASTGIETRSSASQQQQSQQQQQQLDQSISDTEDDLIIDNDSNNNNDSNLNNNNPTQSTKKTEDELLDIVEVSRKRRLSHDSAESLTSFIRWSFSHVDAAKHHRALQNNNHITKLQMDKLMGADTERADSPSNQADEEDEWGSASANFPTGNSKIEQLYRQHASKMAAAEENGTGSSSSNLALIRSAAGGDRHLFPNKRARTQVYSPELKFDASNNLASRKSSSYLGNVVDRLHQQQQQQQLQQQQASQQQEPQDLEANGDLSFHLQQFLQQQTSLEDLCSSVGLDDSNQLVLAAAIHRALVDSMGPNQTADSKSTASSTGSSSGSGGSGGGAPTSSVGGVGIGPVSALGTTSGANLHLIDSLSRQRRAYNTRGALNGLAGATMARVGQTQSVGRIGNGTPIGTLSNRAQQQRHAQAAAALSALASAGAHSHGSGGAGSGGGQLGSLGGGTGNPMVDFECDTCGSSFDDRHRLMQHQSIHLELKKDWFNETPVDEVMKIFNRRRGEFLCNTCNLRFEATFDYDKHNHSVHGQRPYCCQFCGNGTRTFRFWRQYLNHLYDHRYVFSCTIDDCDFTVNRRDSLRFHIFRFHLNCQLPQNQNHLRSSHNILLGSEASKWQAMDDDDDDDQDNEMNVGE